MFYEIAKPALYYTRFSFFLFHMTPNSQGKVQARALALLPLIVFLAIFLGSGIYHSMIGTEFAFYQVTAPVAVLPAIILTVLV